MSADNGLLANRASTEELAELGRRVSAARAATEARGETFYQGPSGTMLAAFPPPERWDDWAELDSRSWPQRVEHRFMLIPTTCFNCESACGLLAYVDRDSLQVRKFEGNPKHPGSRGRNCAKGPATINQVTDPDRILFPLRRAGKRGEGKWERASWDEALDAISARLRKAITEGRQNEIMIHIGRPGEDGFTERVLASWGVDGHNSHTNVCSSGGRTGFQFWTGIDRPSPDHANAKVIFLISSHLETGHYFNPHAQRITEARAKGAKVIVVDTRLSNTATHADYWLSPIPGSEAAINLAIARHIIETGRANWQFVHDWWNWKEYMATCRPDWPQSFEAFQRALKEEYSSYTFDFASAESGIDTSVLQEVAEVVASAGTALSCHSWRSAAASNLGGWQVSRTLFFLVALLGAVATPGGTFPNAYNKYVPRPIYVPPHPTVWQELSWPPEYPLAQNEMSYLLPHFLKDGRGKLDTYFTRVYNPVWTNPDGMSWVEVLLDHDKIGCYVALTPTWNETAYFADWVLPMGHASERHDTHSYEQYDGQWLAFRQPVLRAAKERLGERVVDTRSVNPGEVWEENEFYIELSWRIDPDGSLGIRQYYESKERPGEKLTVDEYYAWMFDHSVPGLPEAAAAEGLTPLQYMRRYGAFEITRGAGPLYAEEVPDGELGDVHVTKMGRVFTTSPRPPCDNIVPTAEPQNDGPLRPVGVVVGGKVRRGFPTPSGLLEFYSSTLASWGWPEHALPGYIRSHVHPDNLGPDEMVLLSTFRLPTQVHTRSANSKWLDELSHTNPLWVHPSDAKRLGIEKTGDLVRVSTEIGYFVVKAWLTEGIRPGVVACSHHMGRWKLSGHDHVGAGGMMSTVDLSAEHDGWSLHPRGHVKPYRSPDPDTQRIWWSDTGVHQNLTFPVHPDPISGMHCWHQAVRLSRAEAGDAHGDVFVDTAKAREVYRRWLDLTRPASRWSPDGTRRPRWLMRPLRPAPEAYALNTPAP